MNKFIIFSLLFLTSCAAYVRTQSTKMISPETHGKLWKGAVEMRLESQARDRLDFADDTVDNAVEQDSAPYALAGLGELGILPRLDVFFQPHASSASILGAKFQFLGKPKAEAKKGNFSASLSAGLGNGGQTYDSNGELDDFFNENIQKIKINQDHEEIGLIAGYRWSENFLHYANAIYQRNHVEGYVTKDSGPLQHTNFEYDMDGVIYSTGFIFYMGTTGYLKLDYSHYVSDWSKTGKHTINTGNAAFGLAW